MTVTEGPGSGTEGLATGAKEPAAKEPATGDTGIWSTDFWGAIVVLMGLAVVVGVFFGALTTFSNNANSVVAVLGAVTGVVGTIVTAFFGIHATAKVGADATQKVAAAGADANQKLVDAGDKVAKAVRDEHNKALAAAAYIPTENAPDFVSSLSTFSTP